MTTDTLDRRQGSTLLTDRDPMNRPFRTAGSLWDPAPESSVPMVTKTYTVANGALSLTGILPPWFDAVVCRGAAILGLPSNWDGYGALQIDPTLLIEGLRILLGTLPNDAPLPAVVPTTRGGVQFEWHCGGVDLEVEVVSQGTIAVSFDDGTIEETHELGFNLSPLVVLFKRLPVDC